MIVVYETWQTPNLQSTFLLATPLKLVCNKLLGSMEKKKNIIAYRKPVLCRVNEDHSDHRVKIILTEGRNKTIHVILKDWDLE